LKANSVHIWMNFPSYYQNDLFNDLSNRFEKFEVIYAHSNDESRRNQGWVFENNFNYKSKIIGKDLKILTLIYYVFKNRKSTHIVNGIWAEKSFFFVIILLNLFNANLLIYSEAPVPTKSRSILKRSLLNFLIIPLAKLLIIRAKGILAVSVFAVEYFKSLGVKSDKIYRFGYFRNVEPNLQNKVINEITQLVFVGQLIERKGITTLLEAIKIVSQTNQSFHLTIIGTGELERALRKFINKNQLQNTVTLLGVINSENVMDYIRKADLLMLSSVFDGWGMVVNEALQSSIPVLISDQCGAKELIKNKYNGLIFKAKDLKSLTENLLKYLNLPIKEKEIMKTHAGEMREKISISTVGNYLSLCVQHALNPINLKPTAPWLND
jgi:glycosyltransferase involved in cell wall biosynthesis